MATHRCKACGIEFNSAERVPPCPSGCRYPHEHPTPRGDYITTEPVEAAPKQEAAPRQEEKREEAPKVPRGRGGRKKDQPEEQY